MKLINWNSYLVMSAIIWIVAARALSDRLSLLPLAVVLLLLSLILYALHRRTKQSGVKPEGETPATAAEAAGGKFALIDFYSDY